MTAIFAVARNLSVHYNLCERNCDLIDELINVTPSITAFQPQSRF